jgi:hypothetical protein
MDLSIRPVTPAIMRDRGADAFDEGRGVDDHHMNPGAPAIADWQAGWHQRRVERSRKTGNHLRQLAEACPP